MDGILRGNAEVGLDEKVEIQKISHKEANALILSPLNSGVDFEEDDSVYLAQILDGTPALKGDKIRAILFGSKVQDFYIEDTDPQNAVLIKPFTKIKIKLWEDSMASRKAG